jgi:hypothetical protein
MAPDRGTLLLKDLRFKLQRAHVERLRRSLHSNITFEEGQGGEFTVIVTPLQLTTASFQKLFSRQLVFAGTFHLSPPAWAVEKRACDYATDIIRECLAQRGIA